MCIDVNDCIDALPILATLGCAAHGTTTLCNAAIARKKESDRISAMAKELKKMGATIIEDEAGLTISRSELHAASLDSHADHRVAMALAVAALQASQKCKLTGTQCINKSYAQFFCDLKRLGVRVS
jgi:3-phosphoshikimate 1-carboxyvinyltransferase